MSVKKAIQALSSQIDKLDDNPDYVHAEKNIWKLQTASYVKSFFGADSREHEFISYFDFINKYDKTGGDPKPFIEGQIKNVKTFLANCIETLEHKGLNAPPKNLLSRISDGWLALLIGVFVPALFVGGTLWGKYLSDVQNIELKHDKKVLQDSLMKRIPAFPNANVITDDSTKNASNKGN